MAPALSPDGAAVQIATQALSPGDDPQLCQRVGPVIAPDAEATARFAESLAQVWPPRARLGASAARLGLAVSGGPDSTALLLLAAAALPGAVMAASIDHRLRPANADEAAAVALLCGRLGVPHATLVVSVAAGNLQAEARRARYAALAGWAQSHALAAIATAHHADDQAETLVLRLNRASGVAGLAGARPNTPLPNTPLPNAPLPNAAPDGPARLVRPLLGWRRAELAAIVAAAGITPADDPSNRDDRFDRARIRKALADADWLDVAALAVSASHLADADAALEWAAAREWRGCVRQEGLGWHYRPQAPRAIALRVIAAIIARLDGEPPRGSAVARLFDGLIAGRPGSLGEVVARPSPGGWDFTRSPLRRAPARPPG